MTNDPTAPQHGASTMRTPEQIQREMSEARARYEGDPGDPEQGFSPGAAASEAWHQTRDTAASVGRIIRDNPVPFALIGLGAAWLAASALQESRYAEAVRRRAQDATAEARARTGHLRERVGEAAHEARERAGELGHRAREGVAHAGHQAVDVFESRPLLIGALGLALGAAIGASLPATRREDAYWGETRDRLKDRAVDYGREQVERAGRAAHEAIDSAKKETERQLHEVKGGTSSRTTSTGPSPGGTPTTH